MEEMSKNQSFRILKLYHYLFKKKVIKKTTTLAKFRLQFQGIYNFILKSTQKNIQSFMESKSKHLSCEQLISELNHHK